MIDTRHHHVMVTFHILGSQVAPCVFSINTRPFLTTTMHQDPPTKPKSPKCLVRYNFIFKYNNSEVLIRSSSKCLDILGYEMSRHLGYEMSRHLWYKCLDIWGVNVSTFERWMSRHLGVGMSRYLGVNVPTSGGRNVSTSGSKCPDIREPKCLDILRSCDSCGKKTRRVMRATRKETKMVISRRSRECRGRLCLEEHILCVWVV